MVMIMIMTVKEIREIIYTWKRHEGGRKERIFKCFKLNRRKFSGFFKVYTLAQQDPHGGSK